MANMILPILAIDNDIIHINRAVLVQSFLKHVIYIVLEGCRPVIESKWYHVVFVRAESCAKGHKILVLFYYTDPVKRILNIDLC
jgi:hypothetical protein